MTNYNDDGLDGLVTHLKETIEFIREELEEIEHEDDNYCCFVEDEISSQDLIIIQTIDEIKKKDRPPKLQKIIDDLEKLEVLEFILGIDEFTLRDDLDFPVGKGN